MPFPMKRSRLFATVLVLQLSAALPAFAGTVKSLAMRFDGLTVKAHQSNGSVASSFTPVFTGYLSLTSTSKSAAALGIDERAIQSIANGSFSISGQLDFVAGVLNGGQLTVIESANPSSPLVFKLAAPSPERAGGVKMTTGALKQFNAWSEAVTLESLGGTSYFGNELAPWINWPQAETHLDVASLMRSGGFLPRNGLTSMTETSGSVTVYSVAAVPLPTAAAAGGVLLGAAFLRRLRRQRASRRDISI